MYILYITNYNKLINCREPIYISVLNHMKQIYGFAGIIYHQFLPGNTHSLFAIIILNNRFASCVIICPHSGLTTLQ